MTVHIEHRRNHRWYISAGLAAALVFGGTQLKPPLSADTIPPPIQTPDASKYKINFPYIAGIQQTETKVESSDIEKIQIAIKGGVEFLKARSNEDIGLLNASPIAEVNNYWLKNDNWLAARALEATGQEPELIKKIDSSLAKYGNPKQGVIEVLAGEKITWPPYGSKRTNIPNPFDANILTESRMPPEDGDSQDTRGLMNDWSEYADLSFYRVIDLFNQSNDKQISEEEKANLLDEAKQIYIRTLQKFDGFGFKDKAFLDPSNIKKHYTTNALALAVIAGEDIKEKYPSEIVDRLLLMQAPDNTNQSLGGFTTLSTEAGKDGDANVEATSFTLIGLSKIQGRLMAAQ